MKEEKIKTSFFEALKTDFLYGLFFILPFIATVWLVIFSIRLISGPISQLLGKDIPILVSFCITIGVITFIGLLARNILGRALLKAFEGIVSKIPLVNRIYNSVRQLISAFSFQDKLLSAVFLEYPRKGVWAMGFITKKDPKGILNEAGEDLVPDMCSVFVPTTPNPTSGYFIYVKKEELIPLKMSVEDSVKILMSAGVITPGEANK
tara:strand:+ start:1597 stop:2217 length:621 start_codon:yes stop_codon:yes gene_type:complete